MSLRRNALLLVLATVVLAIVAEWSGIPNAQRLWCVPAGFLLLGLAYERGAVSRLRINFAVQAPRRWLLGQQTPLRLQLRSSSSRPLEMEVAPSAPREVAMDRGVRRVVLAADRGGELLLNGIARRLGSFSWPRAHARLGGVLGLAWWPMRLSADYRLQVVPDLLREAAAAPGFEQRGTRDALRIGTGTEILQLREYRPGDPSRAIDWKATARQGRLISRDCAQDQSLQIMLAVDAGRASALAAGDSERLALYANVAARFAQRVGRLDDRVGLLVYADRPLAALAPARGRAALLRLRAQLSTMSVQDTDADPVMAVLHLRRLLHQRSLVIWLTAPDDAVALSQLTDAARLLLPKHMPFIAGVANEQIAQLAAAPVDDELEAYRALAAQEASAALERNLQALRALGATALVAPPRILDRAVLEKYLELRQRHRVG